MPGWQSLWLQDLVAEVLRCVEKSHRMGTAFFLGAAKYSAYDIEIPSQAVLCDVHKGRLWMGLDIIQPWRRGLHVVNLPAQPRLADPAFGGLLGSIKCG